MERLRGRHVIGRAVVVVIVTALALLLLSAILSGVDVKGVAGAIGAALIIGALNALIWPLLIRFALPLTVLTLGLGVLVLNGAIVLVAAAISAGLTVSGIGAAIACALGLTLVSTVATQLLSIDDDDAWHRNVLRRRARRLGDVQHSDVPGLLFVEIDGLGYDVLRRAVRDGNAPTMARWMHDGTHRLARWETGWSSQTGACQAGLLHGSIEDIPAFRWWEKDRGAPLVTNNARDAAELERRHSDGRGLLHEDGASRANILSGDAPHSMLTMSTVLNVRRGSLGRDYYAYFARPYGMAKTLLWAIGAMIAERWYALSQSRRDVRPRVPRGGSYPALRAWATVVQRDLQVEAVVADLLAGRPVIYTTFLAYDEVAHHSGIERVDALGVLRDVDHQIARLQSAAQAAPRPYEIVVLSDHGQSQGATFLQRYGKTLEEIVRAACDTGDMHVDIGGGDEALGYVSASLTEAATRDDAVGHAVRTVTRGQTHDGSIQLGAGADEPGRDGLPELSVMASGNLGLISFPREAGRVTLERLSDRYPLVLDVLRNHPGVAFLLVRSERDGLTPARSRASIPWRGSAPAQPSTSAARMPSPTARTSSSTAPIGRTPRRSPPSRSSSDRTAAWAVASRTRSCSSPTAGPSPRRRSPAPMRCTGSCAAGCPTSDTRPTATAPGTADSSLPLRCA
jgi:uncharacterized membrane protein YvlD (DUF360 family)